MDCRSNFMQKSGLLEDLEGQLLAQFDCLDERHLTHKNIVAGPVEGNGCPQPSKTGTDYEHFKRHSGFLNMLRPVKRSGAWYVALIAATSSPAPATSQHETLSVGALSVRAPKAMS
jgi:hypothetical protein